MWPSSSLLYRRKTSPRFIVKPQEFPSLQDWRSSNASGSKQIYIGTSPHPLADWLVENHMFTCMQNMTVRDFYHLPRKLDPACISPYCDLPFEQKRRQNCRQNCFLVRFASGSLLLNKRKIVAGYHCSLLFWYKGLT